MAYDKQLVFESIITSRTRESFPVTDDLIYLGKQIGARPALLKGLYKSLRKLEDVYHFEAKIGANFDATFDYEIQSVHLEYGKVDLYLPISDLIDFLGMIDSVYSPIYPLGSVVELDVELLSEALQISLSEGPVAKVLITGRKVPLGDENNEYLVDYLGYIWPIGQMSGAEPLFISNMMIKNVTVEGYNTAFEENFTEEVLRSSQLGHQQISSAFMRNGDLVAFMQVEVDHEL